MAHRESPMTLVYPRFFFQNVGWIHTIFVVVVLLLLLGLWGSVRVRKYQELRLKNKT